MATFPRAEYLITVLDKDQKLVIVARFHPAVVRGESPGSLAAARYRKAKKEDPSAVIWIRGMELER
jgi:hypothetical protein